MSTNSHDEKRVAPQDAAIHDKERSSSEGAVVSVSGNNRMKENSIKLFDIVAATLLVLGSLNWGFIGLFRVDLVATFIGLEFGDSSLLSRLIYTLIGASAVYAVFQVVSLTAVKRRWTAAPPPVERPAAPVARRREGDIND